jgi:hypothetical protein
MVHFSSTNEENLISHLPLEMVHTSCPTGGGGGG